MPKFFVHPGKTLADELKARKLSAHALARKMHVPGNRISEIINGHRGITTDTALRLGRCLGTTAIFWLMLQRQYDLDIYENEHGATIRQEVIPLSTK